jgi:hypothetical protein
MLGFSAAITMFMSISCPFSNGIPASVDDRLTPDRLTAPENYMNVA